MKTRTLATWALGDQVIVSITRFLIAILIGKYGSDAELGLYSVGFGILVVIVTGQEALFTTPYTYFFSGMAAKRQKSYAASTLFGAMCYLVLLTTLLVVAAVAIWAAGIQTTFLPVLLVLIIATPCSLLREFVRRWLYAHLRIPMATLLDGIFSVAVLAGLYVMLIQNQVTAVTAFIIISIASFLVFIVGTIQFQNEFQLTRKRVGIDAYRNFRFGRWTAGASLLSAALMYFSHWYLAWFKGEAVAGVFAACMTIVLLANPFLLGVTAFLAPRAAREFANQGAAGVKKLIGIVLGIVVVILGIFAVVLFQVGDWLIGLLFDESYRGHQMAIGVLALAMLGLGVSYCVACGLRALVKPQYDLYASVLGLLTTVILTLIFRPQTIESMAICFTCGVATMSVYRTVVFLSLAPSKRSLNVVT